DMVGLRFALLHKPVPDFHRKHDVCLMVSMDVTKFASAVPELDPPEPVRARNDPFPSRDLAGNYRLGAADNQLATFCAVAPDIYCACMTVNRPDGGAMNPEPLGSLSRPNFSS